jgi:hypothetical protein
MPRPDGSGIAVGIVVGTGFRPAMTTIRASLRAGSPIPLTFQPAPKITLAHRLEDLPAHWAGSRIEEVQGPQWWCTTGFPMQRRSDGRTFITTADHCDANVGHPVNEQWWDWLGPHDINHRMGEAWYHTPSLDIAYIRPPTAVQGVTYTNGVAENHDWSEPVAGVGGNYNGLHVCDSGSATGMNCNIATEGSESFWIPDDNSYVTLWYGVQTLGSIAGGKGDSGGPVFSGNPSGPVIAQGSISGSLDANGFKCTNDNGESTTCFFTVAWVDEQSILNNLGANLLTG